MKTFIPSKKNIDKNFINEEEFDNKIINNIVKYISQNNLINLKDLSIEYNKQLKDDKNKIFGLIFDPLQEEIGLSNFTLREGIKKHKDHLEVNYSNIDISFMGFLPDILTFKMKIEKINNSFILIGSNYFALLYRYGYFYLLYKRGNNYSIARISNKVENIDDTDITFVYYRNNFKKIKLLLNDENIIINYHHIQNLFIEKDIRINGWFNSSNYNGNFKLYKYEIYNYDTTL